MSTPEARARDLIDRQLQAAGWVLQHRDELNRMAGRGVAVREFPLPAGEADYLLFVDGKAAGVIEAKKAGTTLSGFAEQSEKYLAQLPEHLDAWADPLPFGYESTGIETLFRDLRDPKPRSRAGVRLPPARDARRVAERKPATLRRRLQQMPPLLTAGLRDCQIEAIENLEALARRRPPALADPDGHRQRQDLHRLQLQLPADQARRRPAHPVPGRSQQPRRPDAARVPGLRDARRRPQFHAASTTSSTCNRTGSTRSPRSCITTIQRLYSMLRGEEEYDAAAEEISTFETAAAAGSRGSARSPTTRRSRSRPSTSSSPTNATARSTRSGARCWSISTPTSSA